MKKAGPRATILWLACVLGSWLAQPAGGCQVPVFRYALERWDPATWKVIVFHRGPLSSEQQRLVDKLNAPAEDPQHLANVEAATIDLGQSPPPEEEDIYRRSAPKSLPWLVLLGAQEIGIVWSGALQEQSVRQLLDSPARRELARRLLHGDSAVWVLLESGDQAKDNAAAATLTEELERLTTELKLADTPLDAPPADPGYETFDAEQPSPGVPLRVAFSVLRLSRVAADEQVFVRTLLDSDSWLATQAEPIAFPVFGRGRVLASLCGSEIQREAISRASEFLVSNCSCIVKGERPGTDLLIAANWWGLLEGSLAVDKVLPPLTGVMPTAEPSDTGTELGKGDGTRSVPAAGDSDVFLRNIGIVLAAVAAVAVVGTLLLWRHGRETQ